MRRDPQVGPGAPVTLPGPGPGEWMWPWWLQRQLDPASPAWLAADLVGRNRTGRNWTVIGVPEGPDRWIVDRRGLLAPVSGEWALDWWIGAEDRWRLPASEPSTRQRLVEGAPVVETVMRVPGGEVVARHWAAPAGNADVVLVEVDNTSAGPVAVALVLRPVGPDGPTGARRVALVAGRLEVDGVTVLRAAQAPRHAVVSTGAAGDVAATVRANATSEYRDAAVECPLGWAGAALVWPLAQRSALLVEVPARGTRPVAASRRPPAGPSEMAQGWAARVTRATRLDLPPGPFTSALEAQRRHLLLAAPGPGSGGTDRPVAAQVSAALSTSGLRSEAGVGLEAWLEDQHRTGRLGRDAMETGATLWALGIWARTGDDDGSLLARSPLAVARAVESLARPAAPEEPLARVWWLAGLQAGARLLAHLGETSAAARAWGWAEARAAGILDDPPAGDAGFNTGTEAALLAAALGAVPAGDRAAREARETARVAVPGVPSGAVAGTGPLLGLRPDLALLVAIGSALAGEDSSGPLRWVLEAASPTWTWPTVIDPRLGTGSHGSGHDPLVAALLWTCGRAHLVADAPAGGPAGTGPRLDILPRLPGEWLGVGLEVHGLATAAGSLSYALRWHGDRPALLWELAGEGPTPEVAAPGLDPSWRGSGRRGDALLAPVEAPAGAADDGGAAPGSIT